MLLIAAVAPIQAVAAASEAHLQTALGVVSLAIFNTLRPGVRRTLLHRVPPLSAAPATAPEKVRHSVAETTTGAGSCACRGGDMKPDPSRID